MDGSTAQDATSHISAALAEMGIRLDETDRAIVAAAVSIYGPAQEVLMAADLSAVAPEPILDPSSPPAP